MSHPVLKEKINGKSKPLALTKSFAKKCRNLKIRYGRGNVRSGKCLSGEMSVAEASVGELSSGKCQTGKCPVGKLCYNQCKNLSLFILIITIYNVAV